MSITNGYSTLANVRARLDISDTQDDITLEAAIEAVSRWIEEETGRRFYATSETRYYTAEFPGLLYVDDLLSVTTLKTDDDGDRTYENTWATTDYDLLPLNAAANGRPYTTIEIAPNGNYSFPTIRKGVQIAGSFGYSAGASTAAPAPIREACVLGAMRLFKRKDVIFGIAGAADLGQLQAFVPSLRKDPDIMQLLWPYKDAQNMVMGI